MNEQRTGNGAQQVIAIRIAKLHANRNNVYFEGYILSGTGSRSVPVGRLVSWQDLQMKK